MKQIAQCALAALVIAAVPQRAHGQEQNAQGQEQREWNTGRTEVTRESLQELQRKLEQTAASSAYSSELRKRAKAEAELVRNRLESGDFHVGDRVELKVDRQPELTTTFTVAEGPVLVLPGLDPLPLAGVLRSEFPDRLTKHLAQYLVDPLVEANPLMPIWIDGAVNQPGLFTPSSKTSLMDAVMKAGGPAQGAKLTSMRIERGEKRIWEGEGLQQAVTEGRTLDQMSLQAGDRLVIDNTSSSVNTSKLASIKKAIWVIPSTIFLISRLMRRF